jgi:uncharacterized protein (DUF924 family)
MLLTKNQINDILYFWFPNNNWNNFWFDKSVDQEICDKYYNLMIDVNNKIDSVNLDNMLYEELLTIIIILDQFSRNINRLKPVNVEEMTNKAKKLTLYICNYGLFHLKTMNHICFILMPLRHTNSIEDHMFIIDILNKIKKEHHGYLFDKFNRETIRKIQLLSE